MSVASGIPLWVTYGDSPALLVTIHAVTAILATAGAFLHAWAAKPGPAIWSGYATFLLAAAATITGSIADGSTGVLWHAMVGWLLATALFVHVGGRQATRIFGGWREAAWAVGVATIVVIARSLLN